MDFVAMVVFRSYWFHYYWSFIIGLEMYLILIICWRFGWIWFAKSQLSVWFTSFFCSCVGLKSEISEVLQGSSSLETIVLFSFMPCLRVCELFSCLWLPILFVLIKICSNGYSMWFISSSLLLVCA